MLESEETLAMISQSPIPFFIDEKTEAQGGGVVCLRSHSKCIDEMG